MDVDMDDDGVDDACDIDIVSTDKESVVVNGGIRKIDDTNTITTDLGIDDKSGNSGDEIMASGPVFEIDVITRAGQQKGRV